MSTADRVDSFVRRQALLSRLKDLFRHQPPTSEQLSQITTLAEVSINQVFGAYKVARAQQEERYSEVKDFAECSALYGFMLGYWQARQEVAVQTATVQATGD